MRYRRLILATLLLAASVGLAAGGAGQPPQQGTVPISPAEDVDAPQAVVARTCAGCHSNRAKAGNLSLEGFRVDDATADRETAEKMIRKLRAGQMPPPGSPSTGAGGPRRPDPRRSRPRWTGPTASARTPHVPAPESRRVRAVGPRPARARHRCRHLPAARHEERELRQHRRRAAALADADAVVPHRGGRDQPAGGRRPARDGPRGHVQRAAMDVAARTGGRRAIRHPRRPLRRAHVPGGRRLPLPRVVLPRDDRRLVRERARGPAHRRVRRSRWRSPSTARGRRCSTSTAG